MNTPYWIIVHHEAPPVPVETDRFDIVDQYHKSLGWGKIGYHYFIERSGQIIQGRADDEEGAHTIGYNTKSLALALAGNMDMQIPTVGQEQALKLLIERKMKQYGILPERVRPHRYFATPGTIWKYETIDGRGCYKSCYGAALSDAWARELVAPSRSRLLQRIRELQLLLLRLLKYKT